MTVALLTLGAVAGLVLLVLGLARRSGRVEARLQSAEETLDVRDRQLKAASRRARDGDELARRLRSGEF